VVQVWYLAPIDGCLHSAQSPNKAQQGMDKTVVMYSRLYSI